MVNRIDLPQQPQGDAETQLRAMYSYLYQMAQALNNNLEEIGGAELTDSERVAMQEVLSAGAEEQAGAATESETLKSLIIKTASYIKTAIDQYNLKLTGSTEAEGKIGKYVRNTQLDVDVTPTGIQQSFSFQEIIQGLKTYEINAKNYIKSGLLRTVNGIPVYGIAVGKDIVTFAEDGTETYNDGNKVAEFTAEELSFWQNGAKVASYKGNGINFAQDVTIASGKKLIIDTENFKINSAGKVTVKGDGEFSGELKAATGTFSGTMSANGITSGTMSADRISGGTLTLGGNNNANGTLIIKDASGARIGEWNKDGISVGKGSFSGETLKVKSGGTLQVEAGGSIDIEASGTLDLTGSEVKIGSGSTFDLESNNANISSSNGYFNIVRSFQNKKCAVALGGNLYGIDDADFLAVLEPAHGAAYSIDYYMLNISMTDKITTGDTTTINTNIGLRPKGAGSYHPLLTGVGIWKENGTTKAATLDAYFGYLELDEEIKAKRGVFSVSVTSREYVTSSSRDIKHDIKDMPSMGGRLDRLRPVTFIYDEDEEERKRYGLIYEETAEVLPEICTGSEENKAINYNDLIPMLLKEIQELRGRVSELERRLENVQGD